MPKDSSTGRPELVALVLISLGLGACAGDLERSTVVEPDQRAVVGRAEGGDPGTDGLVSTESTDVNTSDAPNAGSLGSSSTSSAEAIYERNCQVCHAGDGRGNLGPALADNQNLHDSTYVVARIQLGGGGMPPFASRLTAMEIAAVSNYIRNSWGNRMGEVSPQQVELQWNGYRRGLRYGVGTPAEF